MSQSQVNLESWHRRDLFLHYKDYDNPYFSISLNLDITHFHSYIKQRKYPFSLSLLYLCLRVANEHRSFRYRIRGDQVVLLDQVNAAMTILHDDDCFDFCYFMYQQCYFDYLNIASIELDQHREQRRNLRHADLEEDVIHFAVLPWIHFTNLSHARDTRTRGSIPKIIFGKFENHEKRLILPMAIEVNHALVDGIHVARFVEEFQHHLHQPQQVINMAGMNTAHAVGH